MGLVKKLLIKSGYRVAVVNAPATFEFPVDELPEDVEVTNEVVNSIQMVLLFAQNKAELKQHVPDILPYLHGDMLFWVAYPKKSSKLKSDISRDEGWEILKDAGYVGVSLISIDDTWSGFRVRHEQFIKK